MSDEAGNGDEDNKQDHRNDPQRSIEPTQCHTYTQTIEFTYKPYNVLLAYRTNCSMTPGMNTWTVSDPSSNVDDLIQLYNYIECMNTSTELLNVVSTDHHSPEGP